MKPSVLVTAGPTREKLDPVRFLSNYSTGTFGYEIAKEARRRGLRVILVSGPVHLKAPGGVKLIRVESALEMKRAVGREAGKCSYIIMAAAVSDWRVKTQALKKIKRHGKKTLELVENPDIAALLGRRKGKRVLVTFALETDDLNKNALRKLRRKNSDIIIANMLTEKKSIFGDNKLSVTIFDRSGGGAAYKNRSKRELAKIILDKALSLNIG